MSHRTRIDRHMLRRPCEARFLAGGIHALRGQVCDISLEGACLALDAPRGVAMVTVGPPAVKEQLYLEFELPTGTVEAVAEVRWLTRHADGSALAGLRFLRIPETSQTAIRRLLAMELRRDVKLFGRWVFA
jgi:c-di-GMP-binding flagellar brake protein YcgR